MRSQMIIKILFKISYKRKRLFSCNLSSLSFLFLISDVVLGNMLSKEYENTSFHAVVD